jgi:hypothetical protein
VQTQKAKIAEPLALATSDDTCGHLEGIASGSFRP